MAIKEQGEWWTGDGFRDLADYLREYTKHGHPVRIVLQSVCGCRQTFFRLEADPAEGCARRTCPSCTRAAFIADSRELWERADPDHCACPCGSDLFELAV